MARRVIRLHRKRQPKGIDSVFAPGKDISPVHNGDGTDDRQAQPMVGIASRPGGVSAIEPLEKPV